MSDLVSIYSQNKQPVVGVIYYLVHKQAPLNFINLKERLKGELDIEELYEEDLPDEEEIYVPEVFIDEERNTILLRRMIDEAILTEGSLFGKATIDQPMILNYRDQKLFIINTIEIYFIIFHDDRTSRNYLVILGSRAKSRELMKSMDKFLQGLGIAVSPSRLDPEMIDEIRRELKGDLLDTTLTNFPTPKIKLKRIHGRGYQNEPSYLKDAEVGSVHQHMFEFRTSSNKPAVINLSEDGLVRFYTSISYKNYEDFLKRHILRKLRQAKKPQIPITAYTAPTDIFEEEEKEDGII